MTDNPKRAPTPDAYRQRDRAILRHVGIHGLGITESVNATIGGNKNLGHIIRRLGDGNGDLTLFPRALDGVTYFQLTEKACERLGIPTERSRPLGTQALDKALAVLVWCVLSENRRYKIERSTLKSILPSVKCPTNQVHCVSEEEGRRVWRVQLIQGNHEPAIKSLKHELSSVTGELEQAIASQQYGFAFLVDSVVKQRMVEAAIERSGLRELALIRVDLSATAKTLAAYLRRLRKSK